MRACARACAGAGGGGGGFWGGRPRPPPQPVAAAAPAYKASIPSHQTIDESALMGSDDLAAGDGSFSGGFDGRVTATACEGMTVQPSTEALLVDTTIPVTEVKN